MDGVKKHLDHLGMGSEVLCVVAHMDDEALMCGGLLTLLRDRGCLLTIAVVVDVRFTNAPSSPFDTDKEIARQQRRVTAFENCCRQLKAEPYQMREPNAPEKGQVRDSQVESVRDKVARLINDLRPQLVLSHGAGGEYGHTMHKVVHHAVAAAMREPWLGFARDGSLSFAIDLRHKLELLAFYRVGTTQTPTWEPTRNAAYGRWCQNTESYDWYSPCD